MTVLPQATLAVMLAGRTITTHALFHGRRMTMF